MSKFRPLAITFVFGVAVGIGCGFLLGPKKSQSASAPQLSEPDTHAFDLLESQLAKLERENVELKRALEATPLQIEDNTAHASNSSFVVIGGEGGERPDPEEMIKRMRPHFMSAADYRLAQLSARLNLDEQQKSALNEILVAQSEQNLRIMASGLDESGRPIAIGVEQQITSDDVMDLAREIMTPDQFEEYSQIRTQESESRNDIIATMKLGHLAPALGLSDEQKDAAYSAYYSAAEENLGSFDPEGAAELELKADETIRKMLTPEQQELFDDMLERERGPQALFMGN